MSDKEDIIYQLLFNNVSITEEDRSKNSGKQMYHKLAEVILNIHKYTFGYLALRNILKELPLNDKQALSQFLQKQIKEEQNKLVKGE